jgi:GNAT superfamily N-acetyltransferase
MLACGMPPNNGLARMKPALRNRPMTTVPASTEVRLIEDRDSLETLTDLLHRAYASLAGMGLRYLATHQDVATTRRRTAKGECYLMFGGARLVGTILLIPPSARAPHCAWYNREDVAVLSQFAVEPQLQGRGLGGQLLSFAEGRASVLGAAEVAVDTAESAPHLIAFYSTRGYRQVGDAQWGHTNYRSVILSKRLKTESSG